MAFMKRFFGGKQDSTAGAKSESADKDVTHAQSGTPSSEEDIVTDELEDTDDEERYNTPPLHVKFVPDGATRPLPSEPTHTVAIGKLSFAQLSDIGIVRTSNQDAAFSFYATSASSYDYPDFGLFIVADGMGGHENGEKASSIAIHTVAQQIIEKIYVPLISGVNLNDSERPTIAEILVGAVKNAHAVLLKELNDGGTTLTAVVVLSDWAHIAHVGDSRAYLVTKDNAEQITRDHSMVQRLIELNQITQEESQTHPQRNVLYRAIGQNDPLDVDTMTRRLPAGSQLLICSDGLWGVVTPLQIREVIAASATPHEACEKLVALATTLGSTDNITAIVVKMPTA